MLKRCLCASGKKQKPKSKQDEQNETIHERILPHEIKMLHFIFEDIACRSPQPTLSYHHFKTFLSLTGLWGDKLFQHFNMNKNGKINETQFLFGMARTIKAPSDEKIKILFNFFTDENSKGIRYSEFLKMLYHCSKEQLKQLFINDGVFVQESIIPCTTVLKQKQGQVVHLKLENDNNLNNKTTFEQAYENIIANTVDPGTIIKLKTQNLTYQINYCNMMNLTKQFASHVFVNCGLEETKQMNFQQFKKWITNNRSLFDNYFAAFHQQVWGQTKGKPNFLKYIDKECEVEIQEKGICERVWMMLVGSAIIFSINQNNKEKVFRVIWLYELNIQKANREDTFGIVMKHMSDSYFHTTLVFKDKDLLQLWLQEFKVFEKNYLHAKYDIDNIIGTGKFSTVYKCHNKQDNKYYALKVLNLSKLSKRDQLAIQNQSQILNVLKSPAIVKYHETIYSKRHIYMVTQYVPGLDLFEYVKKNRRLTQYEAALILGQVIQAVSHLHSLDIIHRDLKPQNIMIVSQDLLKESIDIDNVKIQKIKLIDFGFANYISAFDSEKVQRVGTVNYIAPQILLGEKPSFRNDVFALGSILYFMLRGKFAFDSPEAGGIALRTVQGDYSLYDEIWEDISDEAKELVQMLLMVDPMKRISLNEAINHPWFSIAKNESTQKNI